MILLQFYRRIYLMKMHCYRCDLRVLLIFTSCLNYFYIVSGEHNLTEWTSYRRQKRTLIYQNAGVAKFVAGVILPVNLQDAKPWRQMNCAYNIQAQYPLPQKPYYPWDIFGGSGRTLESIRKDYEINGIVPEDQSQKMVYKMIEIYMNNAGKNGRKCLQRAICENAQINEVIGIFSELIYVVLTPNEGCYDADYKDAYAAGKAGVDCLHLYPECPLGAGFLDRFAVDHTTGVLQ